MSNCNMCGQQNGLHNNYCPHSTIEELRAEIAETQRLKDIYWHEREIAVANSVRSGIVMASLRAEVEALTETLKRQSAAHHKEVQEQTEKLRAENDTLRGLLYDAAPLAAADTPAFLKWMLDVRAALAAGRKE